MSSTIFRTPNGREYDLKLDFGIAKRLANWDFTSVSETPFNVMVPTKTDFAALYYDFGLLGAIAFAIVWEREKLAHPEKEFTAADQTAREVAFASALDGETLEALQTALREAFVDFFRKVASDLRKISLAQKTAEEEGEKQRAALVETIREAAQVQLESARRTLMEGGGTSGGWPGNSAGAGPT